MAAVAPKCQLWQVAKGSLLANDTELTIRLVGVFARVTDARAFMTSKEFLSGIQCTGECFIVPEGQMFIILPGRLQPSISISELPEAPDVPVS